MDEYWGTGRTEAFSDGVFAIANTPLILEVSVPESAFDDLWSGIAHQWPAWLAYVTSFLTIGGIWCSRSSAHPLSETTWSRANACSIGCGRPRAYESLWWLPSPATARPHSWGQDRDRIRAGH